MGININCKFADRFSQCTHPDNRLHLFLFKFKKECPLLHHPLSDCPFQEKYPDPDHR